MTDSAGGGVQGWAYDARGNVIDNGPNALAYDMANQPTSVTASGLSEVHTYDGNLKRVKTVRNGVTTYWVYSALTGTPVYQEKAGTGSHYLAGGGTQVKLESGTPEYAYLDQQGSAVARVDVSGALICRELHTPFGETTVGHACGEDEPGYTGHVQDTLSGLTYMQARYYDPVAARFLSTDPIGYQDQFNLYAYVGNDPVNMVDPTGQEMRFHHQATRSQKIETMKAIAKAIMTGHGRVYEELQKSDEIFTLQPNDDHLFEYEPSTKTIRYDPTSGLKTQSGEVQSPALGILHEANHAEHHLNDDDFARRTRENDRQYDNAEERYVITGAERAAANDWGEPTRTDHTTGTPVRVECSTCTEEVKEQDDD